MPVADWLRGPLAGLLREQLDSSAAYSEGWFDRDGTRVLIESTSPALATTARILWPLVTFSCWLDSLASGVSSRSLRVLAISRTIHRRSAASSSCFIGS